jgi:hypothetical protein
MAHAAKPERLSAPGATAGIPRLAARTNGDAVAVWQEEVQPVPGPGTDSQVSVRLVARLRTRGAWSKPEVLCEEGGRAALRQFAVLLDPAGCAHACWATQKKGLSRLEYASTDARGRWSAPVSVCEPTTLSLESPVLAALPFPSGSAGEKSAQQTLFFAWQERKGSAYCIQTRIVPPAGSPHVETLTGQHGFRYAVYPDFFLLPAAGNTKVAQMAVSWYDLGGAKAVLKMGVWDSGKGIWKRLSASHLRDDVLSALPIVRATAAQGLFLLGSDAPAAPGGVFLSSSSFPLVRLDDQSSLESQIRRVTQATGEQLGLLWREENGVGQRLVAGIVRTDGRIVRYPLPQAGSFPSLADVALTATALQALWVAQAPSQSPTVFFSEIPVTPSDWRPIAPTQEVPAQ